MNREPTNKEKAQAAWGLCLIVSFLLTVGLLVAGLHEGAIATAIVLHAFLKLFEMDSKP